MLPEAFANVSLFAGLDPSALRAIAARAAIRAFPKNAVVVNEGDRTDSLYVILSGRVKVFLGDEDGHELVLKLLEPHDYFGELALIDAAPRAASVMTLEPAKFAVIPRDAFMQCLDRQPEIALGLLKAVVGKLRRETESVKTLALMDVYGRVAKLLLELAVEQDGRLVAERLSYKDIAGRVGASREMVGLVLKDLKNGGYITLEGNTIIIHESLPARR